MPPALSDDLLWRIVWKHELDGLKPKKIARHLRCCPRVVYYTLRAWRESGYTNVRRTREGAGRAPPIEDRYADILIEILIAHPEGLITEAAVRALPR